MKCTECKKPTPAPLVTVWNPERQLCPSCFEKYRASQAHPLRQIINHIKDKFNKDKEL